MERASEIGVRKAFGASTGTLVTQFVVENVLLTLLGGAIGFVLSAVVLKAITAAELIEHARLAHQPPRLSLRAGAVARVRPAVRRLSRLAHGAAQPGRRAEGSRAMIRHLLRIVWNRRRANALIAIEILLSFLVLVAVLTMARLPAGQLPAAARIRLRRRLGGSHLDERPRRTGVGPVPRDRTPAGQRERMRHPDARWSATCPRSCRSRRSTMPRTAAARGCRRSTIGGRTYEFSANRASDDFAATMRLTVTRGRWFGAGRRRGGVGAGRGERAPRPRAVRRPGPDRTHHPAGSAEGCPDRPQAAGDARRGRHHRTSARTASSRRRPTGSSTGAPSARRRSAPACRAISSCGRGRARPRRSRRGSSSG